MNSEIVMRPIQVEDVQGLAVGHASAFPRFFLTELGTPFLRQFYKGFIEDPTAVTVVAVRDDGFVLGAAVGTTEPVGFFGRLLRRQFWGFVLASARASLTDPKRVPRLLRAIRYRGGGDGLTPGALLSSIYVRPDSAGAGLGARLLHQWCSQAQNLGSSQAQLTTDANDNDNVNDFYERCGWMLQGQYTTPEGRSMNRYAKDLL